MDEDAFGLERFVLAQDGAFEGAMRELRAGRKTGHWIWFVFPQLAGLGRSPVARQYAISGIEEAAAYLAHPLLRGRLVEACLALLTHPDRPAAAILGDLDALKVRSSMTLFHVAEPGEPRFVQVLDTFYGGSRDHRTIELLGDPG